MDPRGRPEDELTRRLAGTRTRRERDGARIAELAERVDPEVLRERLDVERLLGVLGPRLPDTPNVGALKHAALRFVEDAMRDGTAMELLVESILATLRSASVHAVSLKGPALSRSLYDNPGLRTSIDVDVLVAAADLWRAADALRRLGYGPPPDPLDAHGLPLLHLSLPPPPGLVRVELHWRIHWYETRFARELLHAEDAVPRRRLAVELVALLCFYARDGFAGLRLAADIARWWDRHGDALEPEAVSEILDEYPELGRAVVTAAAVAGEVVGVPFERVVASEAQRREASAAVVERVNWAGWGTVQQQSAQTGLFDVLLAPEGARIAAARRELVRPAAAFRYGGAGGPRSPLDVRVAQVLHPVRTVARFAVALAPARLRAGVIRGWVGSSRAAPERLP